MVDVREGVTGADLTDGELIAASLTDAERFAAVFDKYSRAGDRGQAWSAPLTTCP